MVPGDFNFRQDFKVLYLLKCIENNEMAPLGNHIIWECPLYFKKSQWWISALPRKPGVAGSTRASPEQLSVEPLVISS